LCTRVVGDDPSGREQALEPGPIVALERRDLGSDLAASVVERAHAQDLRTHRDRLLTRDLERELELDVGIQARGSAEADADGAEVGDLALRRTCPPAAAPHPAGG